MTENTIAAGSSDFAPKRVKLDRASIERTTPVAAPAKATSGNDMDPISSSCRNSSRNSNGGVTAACTTRQKNMPRSPNHSRNLSIGPKNGFGDISDPRVSESGGSVPATALKFLSIIDLQSQGLASQHLVPNRALRAHR